MIKDLLSNFWKKNIPNIVEILPGSYHKAAATDETLNFIGTLKNNKWNTLSYSESIRPLDGRQVFNPNRLIFHYQFEIILKPAPYNSLALFRDSILSLYRNKDFSFELLESNWSQPSLGAYGVGYECRINGLEVAQITYFTKMANISLDYYPIEFAYGIERLEYITEQVDKVSNIDETFETLIAQKTKKEQEYFTYFHALDNNNENIIRQYNSLINLLEYYLKECKLNMKSQYVAYDMLREASYIINILDAKSLITRTTKKQYILKLQDMVKQIFNE